MSIEIEVGLENATRIPLNEEPPPPPAPKGLANPRVRKMLIGGGIVVLAVVAALLLYYRNRESTDDAQVDGHITPIAAKISGRRAIAGIAARAMTANQISMIGPKKAATLAVPRDCTANSMSRISTVSGTT